MQHLTSPASIGATRRAVLRMHSGSNGVLALTLVLAMTVASSPAAATTLYQCKLHGKTILSDTDCPREVRIRNDTKSAKPRVIRIRQKVVPNRSR